MIYYCRHIEKTDPWKEPEAVGAEASSFMNSHCCSFVHDAILSDLVYPAEVVGKRIRMKLDGKQILKVHLDKTQQTNVEHKADTFSQV
jgi:hypothetical protein